jgi:hypothetical protein
MPISHVTKVFAVTDAKLYKLTADPAGGSPTYSAGIDVPGIKKVTIKGDVETKQLRGDNTKLDSDTVLTNITAEIEHAKLSLDALAMMLTQTVTDAGTTPNQTAALDIFGGNVSGGVKFAPFKIEAISATADVVGGNVKFQLHKCVLNSFPDMGLAEEDYQTSSFGVDCSPLISNGKWITPTLSETAAVLP